MEKITNQSEWIERAKEVLPAGGFGNFDPSIFIREGRGSRVWDEDGNEYVDYLIGSGPKTFREECKNIKYSSLNGCSSHPHNILLQSLSETGIIGFLLGITMIFSIN